VSVNSPLGATSRSGAFELRLPATTRDAVARPRLGTAGLVGLILLTLFICISASGTQALLPASTRPLTYGFGELFGGVHIHLPAGVLLPLLTLLFACYAVAVGAAERFSARTIFAAIAALNVVVLLAPPLMSMDVFSYESYARMYVTYANNPYLHGPLSVGQMDFLFPFVGEKWISTPTAYGPVFTLLSVFIDKTTFGANACLATPVTSACYSALLVSTIVYKVLASVAGIVIVAILWHAARLRGLNQVRAVAVFGLNPLVVIYGVGGGHNDLLMLVFTTLGVYAILAQRERASGALIAIGAGIKLTGALLLPFALASGVELGAGRRRRALLIGAGAASVVIAVVGYAAFGFGQLDLVPTLQHIQAEGDTSSVPGFLSIVLRLDVVGHVVGMLLGATFLAIFLWLLHRVWRGKMDWIDGAGWATVAILMTASSMLPWYAAWLMPLVALCTSRRLWRAGLWLTGFVQLITMIAYIPH
jgi:alpha-1,6-mannosyltransferase